MGGLWRWYERLQRLWWRTCRGAMERLRRVLGAGLFAMRLAWLEPNVATRIGAARGCWWCQCGLWTTPCFRACSPCAAGVAEAPVAGRGGPHST